jgi:hypothetical protein
MRNLSRVLLALALAALSWGCESRDRTDSGGVVIAIGNVTRVDSASVNVIAANGELTLPTIQLRSIVVNQRGSSELMDIQIQSYEVTYTRADGGTRVPPPLVRFLTGSLPAGGNLNISNLVILWEDQITSQPISDLLFINGGLDRETGRTRILLNANIRFFGRTLGGREVASDRLPLTIELVP